MRLIFIYLLDSYIFKTYKEWKKFFNKIKNIFKIYESKFFYNKL